MIMFFSVLTLIGNLLFSENKEFFDTAEKEYQEGARWHYVGPQDLDPNSKSLPFQVENGKPYIIFKLKKPE